MRILMINDYGYKVGGVETYLNDVRKELSKHHDVKLLSSNIGNPQTPGDFYFAGFSKLPKFIYYPLRIFNIFSLIKLKMILITYKPNIIHLHYIYDYVSPSVLSLLKKHPTIMTLHTQTLVCPLNKFDNKMGILTYKKFDRSALKIMGPIQYYFNRLKYFFYYSFIQNVDLFLSVSNFIKRSALNGGISPVETLYLGITLPSYQKYPKDKNILVMGRLSQHKGVNIAINAFKEILSVHSDATLTIVGEGEERENLEQLSNKLNLSSKINFTGNLTTEEIYNKYAQAQIVIMPSIWEEPFGLVGIEAMAVGRPVVATNIGGIPEWLIDKKNGLLTKPNSSRDLALKINMLLSNPRLGEQMGKSGATYAEKYNIHNHTSKLLKIYQELINKYTKL